MHRQGLKLRLAIISVSATLVMTACRVETNSVSNEIVGSESIQMKSSNQHRATFSPQLSADESSCVDPVPNNREQCEHYEQQILAAVVRFEVKAPSLEDQTLLKGSGGHGTIKDGRFIVVHNHFAIDLSVFTNETQGGLASMTLYDANGYMLLRDVRPPLFEIVVEDQETLVLDFGTNDEGEGFFDWYRVPSAPFKNSHEITIQAGSEVAQVNWDGQITYIDWVEVQQVITHKGVPRLVLANPIFQGSSGGGVFWNGAHVANNWSTVGYMDEEGTETYQTSIAVLNSAAVAPD